MHHPNPYGASAYRAIGIETGVAAADPLGLVVMLYDGAIHAIARAENHLAQGEIEARGLYTGKAIDIINQGLAASLDRSVGGELAESLAALYDYMGRLLLTANLKADPVPYGEVRGLLVELRAAWNTLRQSHAPLLATAKDAAKVGGERVRGIGRSLAA